jgi:hypothetical protein
MNHSLLQLHGIDIEKEASDLLHIMLPSQCASLSAMPTKNMPKKPRKPRKNNKITSSALRPHVLAGDRLLEWITPHAIGMALSFEEEFPSIVRTREFEVLTSSSDPSTHSGYGAGLLRFMQYCDKHGIEEEKRMPASESLIVSFAADAAGCVSLSALNTWLAGLHFWHIVHDAPWHGGERLTQVKKGVWKLVPISSKRKKRPPVTLEHMISLRKGLNLVDSFDASIWAVACVVFWSCCRLGELLIPSPETYVPTKHVACDTDLSFSSVNGMPYASLRIPWTKTMGTDGAVISITSRSDPTCPVAALRHRLACNGGIPDAAPFFAYRTVNGSWSPMTRGWFLGRGVL